MDFEDRGSFAADLSCPGISLPATLPMRLRHDGFSAGEAAGVAVETGAAGVAGAAEAAVATGAVGAVGAVGTVADAADLACPGISLPATLPMRLRHEGFLAAGVAGPLYTAVVGAVAGSVTCAGTTGAGADAAEAVGDGALTGATGDGASAGAIGDAASPGAARPALSEDALLAEASCAERAGAVAASVRIGTCIKRPDATAT